MDREACQRAVDDYKRLWEARDARAMAEMFTEDGVFIDPRYPFAIKGRVAIQEYYEWQLERVIDPKVQYLRVLIDPPCAVAEWYSWLTRLTGERIGVDGLSIFEVRDGKVALQRDYFDVTGHVTAEADRQLYRPDWRSRESTT